MLWYRPAATALIRPLFWEPPYAAGAALEKTKKKKERMMVGKAGKRNHGLASQVPSDLQRDISVADHKGPQHVFSE